jgi:hypothetical protein
MTHKGLSTTHGQLLSTVEKALGKFGRHLVVALFLGLFSFIMMAYLDKGGSLILDLIQTLLNRLFEILGVNERGGGYGSFCAL